MPGKILLIDDDTLFRRSISLHLHQAGYKVKTAASAEDGLIISRDEPIDLVLLDVGLPGMDGLDALKYFNNEVGVPVIFVTARRRKLDEVLGLELGADDYITKPFDTSVLLARIKAVLRRSQRTTSSTDPPYAFSVGDISIDPRTHTVEVKGMPVDLTPSEFKLLLTLALDAEQIISSDDLLARVWGAEYVGQPQVVYVHLRGLRKKIEENPNRPKRIITVRGVGYKLVLQEAL
jgi:DNA-binding response OmpR family regulator